MNVSKTSLHSELKVLFVVAFLLVLTDVSLRINIGKLSGNIAHINSFDQTIIKIKNSNKKTILVIGNSLIGNAINKVVFRTDVRVQGDSNTDVYKMVPDGTAIWDWYCIAKNKFTGNKWPGLVINGFAWSQLSDEERPDPSRLAGHFCTVKDLPDLYGMGLSNTEDIMEYILAAGSSLFANREAVNKRILTYLIPHYKRSTQLVNNAANKRHNRSDKAGPIYTYNLLRKYLALFNKGDSRVVLIAMPVIDDYAIDNKLISLIKSSGNIYLDYRHLTGVTPDLFIDPIHLGKTGSEIFSGKLAADIAAGK